MILDSAPGLNDFWLMTDGVIAALPSTPVLKQSLAMGVYGLLGLVVLKETITGEDNFIPRFRNDLNNEELFRSERGRVYIYGKEDKLVGWRDVESHAKEAKEKRLGEVRVELWEKSPHVGHMSANKERYWDIVRKLWDYEPTIKSKL